MTNGNGGHYPHLYKRTTRNKRKEDFFLFGLTNRTLSIYNVNMDKLNIFKSLSNEARLQILEWLKDPAAHFGPQDGIDLIEVGVCVSQITEKLNMTQSTASQYLSTLQKAGLIKATRIGKWTYYKRDEEAIKNLGLYIQKDL